MAPQFALALACGLLSFAAVGLAAAQERAHFPTRAVRIVVAASPGSSDEFFARVIGEDLGARYGRRVVVDSRPGAGGLIGNLLVSRADADGHTLGLVGVTRMITALLREPPPFQPLADIAAVAHVASITNVLVATPAISPRSAGEFVRYARARPGELNFASLGIGSASHLAGEVLSQVLRVEAVHVPFSKLASAQIELGQGRVHYAVMTLPSVLGTVREGRLQALAVMTARRSPALPSVPSIVEAGLPDAQVDRWAGVVAPRGTDRRIIEQLHGDILQGLRKPALQQRFRHQGAETVTDGTPDSFMRLMQVEYLRYAEVIRERGIRAE